jgi:hypothetical protein
MKNQTVIEKNTRKKKRKKKKKSPKAGLKMKQFGKAKKRIHKKINI